MHTLIEPMTVVLLFVLVRAGDIAISAAAVRDVVRAICYGIVAVLALIALIVVVFGLH
jgi:hypothetical protein